MSELDTLKKENKRLKSLLKNAVQLLNTYKKFLKHPEAIGIGKMVTHDKKVRSSKAQKKALKPK
jgi:hypothetical protein